MSCAHNIATDLLEYSRIVGKNYDLVVYDVRNYCLDCDETISAHRMNVQELTDPEWKSVDESNHHRESPARYGT